MKYRPYKARRGSDQKQEGKRLPGRPGFGHGKNDRLQQAPKPYQPPPTEGDQESTAQSELPTRRPAPIPPPQGVPVVHLKSASYGVFIYNRMVDRVEGNVEDGDLVAVADKYGRMFGWGFYSSRSQIALRMFSRDVERPAESLLSQRVRNAIHLRRNVLKIDRTTDAFRLIHAEGDGLSGLIADRFGKYVVIELFSLAMFRRLHQIEDTIVDAGLDVQDFIVRADKPVMEHEGFSLPKIATTKDRSVIINENGVKFQVMLSRGHKTGFFCDQRENRLALTAFTSGKSVLDVCCYTGGFACYAAALGKAAKVTAVDLDEKALVTAGQNAALNSVKIDFDHADAFDYLRRAQAEGKKWDVVVVDPSKFVPRRDAMEIGLHKYSDLNRLAAGVVAPGGIMLTCSCSGLVDQPTFVHTIGKAARYAGRDMQIFRITGAAQDHPVMADAPESGYLKAVWARLA